MVCFENLGLLLFAVFNLGLLFSSVAELELFFVSYDLER